MIFLKKKPQTQTPKAEFCFKVSNRKKSYCKQKVFQGMVCIFNAFCTKKAVVLVWQFQFKHKI